MSNMIDHEIKRLLVMFAPPETSDPDAYMAELKRAMSTVDKVALSEGVSALIKKRKYRTFPSVGEIIDAANATLDRPKATNGQIADASQQYADDDQRRANAIALISTSRFAVRAVENGWHGVLFDFVMAEGRLPFDNELPRLKAELAEVEAAMSRTRESQSTSVFAHITLRLADAVQHRRMKLADEINAYGLKEAAQ